MALRSRIGANEPGFLSGLSVVLLEMPPAPRQRVAGASGASCLPARESSYSLPPRRAIISATQSEEPRLTELLLRWRQGDEGALELLMPLVYQELKRLARRRMFGERQGHTLQPTELVNEAYVRLCGSESLEWRDRSHFFAVASKVMRNILVDHARGRSRLRRGGELARVSLDEALSLSLDRPEELVALDEALENLEQVEARKAQVVQLRYFGGLSLDETAEVLGVSQVTVVRDWRLARAWLLRALQPGAS